MVVLFMSMGSMPQIGVMLAQKAVSLKHRDSLLYPGYAHGAVCTSGWAGGGWGVVREAVVWCTVGVAGRERRVQPVLLLQCYCVSSVVYHICSLSLSLSISLTHTHTLFSLIFAAA